jgi:3-deoxy-D-manno-octulosonic-acid transferase
MLIFYNFLQITLLLVAAPFLALLIAGRRKYRERFWQRLGFGLQRRAENSNPSSDTGRIWLHCLSVGEVTSALPLLKGLHLRLPAARVIVTVTTSSGMRVAEQQLAPFADLVLAAPLDLLPVINRYIRVLRPDLFILVETDFWPNWLHAFQRRGIPAMLVNGRISRASFARYQRFRFLFGPLFSSFALLAMQTGSDAAQMQKLGVPAERLLILGNLKYAPAEAPDQGAVNRLDRTDLRLPPDSEVWICGSTHPGEEELLLPAFASLTVDHPRLILLLAPRDPKRTPELSRLARRLGLDTMRRTSPGDPPARILILDTLGELASCYHLARLAFIGGSLVPCGGHNPLEASRLGIPVLFGPHMEDFAEIARDLLECGGAEEVSSPGEISAAVRRILEDGDVHAAMRAAAAEMVTRQAGVIDRHLAALTGLLNTGRG